MQNYMEDPDISRRRAIQNIYFDTALTPTEKHTRIQEIQGKSDSDSENMSIYTEGLSRQGSTISLPRTSTPPSTNLDLSTRQGSNISLLRISTPPSILRKPTTQPNSNNSNNESIPVKVTATPAPPPSSKASSDTESFDVMSIKEEENEGGGGYSLDSDEHSKDDDTSVQTEKTFSYRRKRACRFCMASLLFASVITGTLMYFYWDWVEENFFNGGDTDNGVAGTSPSTALSPTTSPTEFLLYDPPTPEQCESIAAGTFEPQDSLIVKTFEIPMDVNLEYETTDVDVMVDMLNEKLQSKLAPKMAGCSDVRRLLRTTRKLDATAYIVENVIMEASHQAKAQCITKQDTCYRVLVDVSLYLHGNESTLPLVSRIGSVFGSADSLVDKLELPSPFDDIQVHAVFATFPTESPTMTPTTKPSVVATPSPTKEPTLSTLTPTKGPTAAPTIPTTLSPTGVGTSAPTMSRQTMLEKALQDNGVDTTNAQAMEWLANEDEWQYDGDEEDRADVMTERYALAVIYDQLGGEKWSENSKWMSTSNHCEWHGVACDNESTVTVLELGGNQLSGLIPTELGLLSGLVTLNMDTNQLSKTLVTELAELESLEHLMLGNNALTGELPAAFGNLANLATLQLDDNKFKKVIPTEVGQMLNLSALSLCKYDYGICICA
jgi:Leucine-rich repeat (LRR) protein